MSQKQNIDCSDLFESAANEAKCRHTGEGHRLYRSDTVMSSEFDYADYNGLLALAKKTASEHAQTFIPKLCEALEKENPEMPREDVRDTVTNDCADVWSKATIRKFMPDEYKDPQKQEAGRLGNKKKYEDPITAGTGARTNLAEHGSDSKTEQESGRFEDADRGPDVKPTHKLINQLQNELKNVRDTYEARLKEEKEKLSYVQNPENLEKIPEVIDDKIGPVKIQNLSKISQFERKGYQILAGRFAELIRRKLSAEGKASIKFYVIGKDRSTNVESLVPVSFIVDLKERATDLILDESRL